MSNQDTLQKVRIILDNENTDILDSTFIEYIKLIFANKTNNSIQIPEVKKEYLIYLSNIVDIFHYLLQKNKDERINIYQLYEDEINDKKINEKLKKIQNIPNVSDNLANNKLKNLYNIITKESKNKLVYNILDYSFSQFAFILKNDSLLKFIIFSQVYSLSYKQNFILDTNYINNEIDLNDDFCIQLIINLFEKSETDNDILAICLLINLFGRIKNLKKKYDLNFMKLAMNSTIEKIRRNDIYDKNLFFENVATNFGDELKNLSNGKNIEKNIENEDGINNIISLNNKRNNENNKKENIILKNEKGDIIISDIYDLLNQIKNMEDKESLNLIIEKIEVVFGKLYSKIDGYKNELKKKDQQILELKEENKEQILKLKEENEEQILKLKEENEEQILKLKEQNKEHKEQLLKLKEDNEGIHQKIQEQKNDLQNKLDEQSIKIRNLEDKQKKNKQFNEKKERNEEKLKLEVDKLKKDVKELEIIAQRRQNTITNLENDLYELKAEKNKVDKEINNNIEYCKNLEKIIGNIQFRKFAKNFLKFFKKYLTPEDLEAIKKDPYIKNKLILNRFQCLFSKKCKNKKLYNTIENLIIKTSQLLNSGNNNAHSITLNNYKNQIIQYKSTNNLLYLYSPLSYVFCINLKLSKNMFEESFKLLTKYFDENLKIQKNKIEEFEFNFN